MKHVESKLDVVTAAKTRIKNVFSNGLPVFFSFSGGKDSLTMAQLIMELANEGTINLQQLTVQFVDEEAIFPCIERTTMEWRRKFILAGARFEWYCIEVRHYNCFNELQEDESFICWDRFKQDVWVRTPPEFAIRSHPLLKAREDTYQDFMPRVCSGGITITGVRAYESVQRMLNISRIGDGKPRITNNGQILPIYDWRDNDVWLYLRDQHVEIPDVYLYLWQSGTRKNQLRVSQFFSVDTAKSLVSMNEYYPDLLERVIRREPNAYLAALYWDSEMFGRRTRTRAALEGDDRKDYKGLLLKMLGDMDRYFNTASKRKIAEEVRTFFLRCSAIITYDDCRSMYELLIRGDPKRRAFRALYQSVYGRYIASAKREVGIVG